MRLSKDEWLKRVHEAARKHDGECLEKAYVSAHEKMKFRCSHGHVWFGRAAGILRGVWCAKCAVIKQHIAQRTPFKKIEDVIVKNGGKLLTSATDYQHKQTKLTVICSQGHQFQTMWDTLNAGGWCYRCGRVASGLKQRLDISVPRQLAVLRGGSLVSKIYSGSAQRLEWKCRSNHAWKASYSNVLGGTWCKKCSLVVSISESIVRKYFEVLTGLEFHSVWLPWMINDDGNLMELDGYNEKYQVAFEHHGTQHYRESTFYKGTAFQKRLRDDHTKKSLCHQNGIKLLEVREVLKTTSLEELRVQIITFAKACSLPLVPNYESLKIDINCLYAIDPLDRFREICIERGGLLLSSEWTGHQSKYEVVCNKHKHHWKIAADHLQSGRWCPECKRDTLRIKGTKHTIEEMRAIAKERGGSCLSTEYKSFASLLIWRCSKGHEWKANAANISLGTWCKVCAVARTADSQRGNIHICEDLASQHDGKCISKEYINARTNMEWLT